MTEEQFKEIARKRDEINALIAFIDGKLFDGFGEWAWKYAVRDVELKDFKFHDLRHCFATSLIQNRVDVPTIQVLLGHSKMEMTMRYSHLAPGRTTEAVRILDRRAGNG